MACLRCDDKIAIVNCVPFSPALPYALKAANIMALDRQRHVRDEQSYKPTLPFWGAKGAPILFSEIGFCVASCSYISIYIIESVCLFVCSR